MDLSAGAFALAGALIGGYFTSRAATSGRRLEARGDAINAFDQVTRRWFELRVDEEPDLERLIDADRFHQENVRLLFIAGVPMDLVHAFRSTNREYYGYMLEGEEPPDVVWEYGQTLASLIELYLEHPVRARLYRRSRALRRMRRQYGSAWGHAPAT